jgi:hypothetical protein
MHWGYRRPPSRFGAKFTGLTGFSSLATMPQPHPPKIPGEILLMLPVLFLMDDLEEKHDKSKLSMQESKPLEKKEGVSSRSRVDMVNVLARTHW